MIPVFKQLKMFGNLLNYQRTMKWGKVLFAYEDDNGPLHVHMLGSMQGSEFRESKAVLETKGECL